MVLWKIFLLGPTRSNLYHPSNLIFFSASRKWSAVILFDLRSRKFYTIFNFTVSNTEIYPGLNMGSFQYYIRNEYRILRRKMTWIYKNYILRRGINSLKSSFYYFCFFFLPPLICFFFFSVLYLFFFSFFYFLRCFLNMIFFKKKNPLFKFSFNYGRISEIN